MGMKVRTHFNFKEVNNMMKFKKIICYAAAMAISTAVCAGVSASAPSWSGVDENGNALIHVQNPDGTWEALPTWYQAYAELDYNTAPDDVKEIILAARRCIILEKLGISSYELYVDYIPDAFK